MLFKSNFKLCVVLLSFMSCCNLLYAQTNWTKYHENPVLKRDTVLANLPNDIYAISDCWVMKDGATYKMWYTCGGLNYPADTLLRARLCYATSADGIIWNKHAGNPVLDVSYTGGWDSLGVETATVIVDSAAPASERYKMWYAGQYFNTYRYDIGYAFSPDGINWTKHHEPVLMVGAPSQWDNGFLEGPSVIKEGNEYKMWYCGYDAVVDGSGTDGRANIGLATSTDGINWTKHPGNPVLTTGTNSWDSIYVQDPHVIKINSMYYMWFGGGSNDAAYDQQVGFATSSDGINWTKSHLNPVLARGNPGEWDQVTASFPTVLLDNGTYKMWYTGKDSDPLPPSSLDYFWEIGYATAPETNSVFNKKPNDKTLLTVYPNPAEDEINISVSEQLANADIIIVNAFGQIIQTTSIPSNSQKLTVSTEHLKNGIYFLQLIHETHSSGHKIIIAK